MKKLTLAAFIVFCLFAKSYSQKENLSNKWNLKLGYYNYEDEALYAYTYNVVRNLSLDVNYNITKFLEIGGMLGYGYYTEFVPWVQGNSSGTMSNGLSSVMLYGVNVNIQLLPLVIKKGSVRFDLYMSNKLGGSYKFSSAEGIPEQGNYFEYATFLGASYYFGRHFGIFVEGGFSNTSKIRYGLAYKF